jgi:hypothetical protein
MSRDLVTIATFANAAEASPARMRLEDAGLPTYLHGGVQSGEVTKQELGPAG